MQSPIKGLLLFLSLSWQASANDSLQAKLYVSESMGFPALKALTGMQPDTPLTLIFRGLPERAGTLRAAISDWHSMTRASRIAVEINPLPYQLQRIERVPHLSLEDKGKAVISVTGVTSIDWLMKQYKTGKRGYLGEYGQSYPINEPDFLNRLMNEVRQLDWSAIQTNTLERILQREGSRFSFSAWLEFLKNLFARPAYASADSKQKTPAKALCQSVPILSERLIYAIPWKELFPIRIGLATMGSGKEPRDSNSSATGFCSCQDSTGVPHPGVTVGFWRPQWLVELTRSPGCLMALGGHQLPMIDQRRWGTLGSANIPKGLMYMHAHVYSLPLLELLNLYSGLGRCNSDLVDFDLVNLSEVDPSWNHPELAGKLSPDMAAYANPAAMNACTADGLSALKGEPKDSIHWCAGSWGLLYPLSGFTSSYGHFADNTSLLATRALAKLHRIGLGKKTVGQQALCRSPITPWLPKSQYKMSMFWPEPEKQKAHWVGASAATWGLHRHPLAKDDAIYLVWQYRECCQTLGQ